MCRIEKEMIQGMWLKSARHPLFYAREHKSLPDSLALAGIYGQRRWPITAPCGDEVLSASGAKQLPQLYNSFIPSKISSRFIRIWGKALRLMTVLAL